LDLRIPFGVDVPLVWRAAREVVVWFTIF
jgi:hypothetical protein